VLVWLSAYVPADATATHYLMLQLIQLGFYLSGTDSPGSSQTKGL